MATYDFTQILVWDSANQSPARSLTGKVYDADDTGYLTPLPIRDQSDIGLPSLSTDGWGVLPAFRVDDHPEVRWVADGGSPSTPIFAVKGLRDDAAASRAAAEAAQVASEQARDDALNAAVNAVPTDAAVEGVFNTALGDPASQIRQDLDASYATVAAAAAAQSTADQAAEDLVGVTSTANTALSTANAAQDRLPVLATVDTLPAIVYDAHRGGAGESPENTLQALRSGAVWSDVLDLDSQVIGDGTVVLMHDSTVDRTTKSAGNVSLYNAAQWAMIRSDPSTWFAAGAPDLALPTVEEVLDVLGGKRVMTVEAKTAAGVPGLAKLIKDRHLERSVLINTNSTAVVPTIKANGCLAHLWRSAAQMATDDATTIKNTGADLLDLDINGTDAQITAAVAKQYPFGVWAHTLVRRKQRDRALSLGCRGIITDFPGYVSGKAARRTSSSFSSGLWGYGYVPSAQTPRPVLDSAGRIPLPPPASINIADAVVLLAGEVSPAPANGTIDVQFSFPTAGSTGWSLFSVHVGSDDDDTAMSSAAIVQNGYTFQVSNDRSLRIFRDDKAAGTTTNLVTTATGAALAANTVYTMRIVITATQLTVSIVEIAGLTATVTDSSYRVPWFIYVGRNFSGPAVGNIWVNSISTS